MTARTASKISRPSDPLARFEADVTARVVDLRCVVKRRLTGETLFSVGGRWDRVDKVYLVEPAKRGKVLLLNEAQVLGQPGNRIEEGPAWALKTWIEARQRGDKRIAELDFDGPRGSGKTHLGALAVWLIAIAFPEAECWLVSPANTRRHEIVRIVKDQVPLAWRTGWSERDFSYTLPNQSTVRYLGADDEDGLKRGGFEVAFLNEAQLITSVAYANAVAGIRNLSGRPKGLLILGFNYASKERGEWTNDHLDKIEAGTINAKHHKLDPRLNISVDADVHDDVEGLIRSVRPDIADIDALGIRKRLGDYAAPAFKPFTIVKGGHVGSPPPSVTAIDGRVISKWPDITRQETAKKTNTQNGFAIVVNMDFQKRPGCVASIARLFQRDDGKTVYHTQKMIVAGDNEDDLCQRVDAYLGTIGLTARDALAICDSTGRFQNAAHTQNTKPSHDIVKEYYFTVVAPRRARSSGGKAWMNANPLVEESLAQFYDICTDGRFLVAEGEDCEWLVESLRRCKIKKRGGTIRLDDSKPGYSHPVDTARYMTWYFEPRRGAVPVPKDSSKIADVVRGIRVFNAP